MMKLESASSSAAFGPSEQNSMLLGMMMACLVFLQGKIVIHPDQDRFTIELNQPLLNFPVVRSGISIDNNEVHVASQASVKETVEKPEVKVVKNWNEGEASVIQSQVVIYRT